MILANVTSFHHKNILPYYLNFNQLLIDSQSINKRRADYWYAACMGKLITLIIIVSTVWSVISGLIEKHKKDKIKASQRGLGSTQTKQAQQSLRVTVAQQATPAELFEGY